MRQWTSSILLVVALLVAACAQSAGTTTRIARLTQENPAPTTAHIVRPGANFSALPALDITVTDAPTVANLYHQAFALPEFTPAGAGTPINCPADRGLVYTMTFYRAGQDVLDLSAYPTGCATVVLGSSDYRQPDDAFWAALATAIGGPVSDSGDPPYPVTTPHPPYN